MKKQALALSIASSDSGGAAGIQADLKTFQALQVYGLTVLTGVTAQNPQRITRMSALSASMVEAQLTSVLDYFKPKVAKTGLLHSVAIIKALAQNLTQSNVELIVDPLLYASSGRLLHPKATFAALNEHLFPLASLITPNLIEAEHLIQRKISTVADMEDAAHQLGQCYQTAVLLKGGHLNAKQAGNSALRDVSEASIVTDVLWDKVSLRHYSTAIVPNVNTHGGGCTLAAAIVAYRARGNSLAEAVGLAIDYTYRAMQQSIDIGVGDAFINHMAIES